MRLIAILVPALALAAAARAETTHQTLHFTGTGPHALEVRTISGRIHIEGYDGADVEMTIDKSISAQNANDLQAAQHDVVLEVADNLPTLRAIARYANRPACGEQSNNQFHDWPEYEVSYDFTIRVPRNTQLTLCTVNRGEVTVKGTRADFDITSVNGRIDLTDMGGSGNATTVNGGVKASFTAAPRGNSLFRTINGDIVLTIPEPFAADLNMKSYSGGLYTDFETRPRAMPVAAAPQRKDGKFVYQTNAYAAVRVGAGGPVLTLDTFNGDARVLRRAP